MDFFDKAFNFVSNPATAYAFLFGLLGGGAGGFTIQMFLHKRIVQILERESERLKIDAQNAVNERDGMKQKLEQREHQWEYEKSDYQTQIKALSLKIRTAWCTICGSDVQRDGRHGVHIKLKCLGQSCGESIHWTEDDLKALALGRRK